MANFSKKLGHRIREIRKLKNLSQELLAEKANISSKYIGEVERGESSISATLLNDIAIALLTPISEIMQYDHKDDNEKLKNEIYKFIDHADSKTIQKLYLLVKHII